MRACLLLLIAGCESAVILEGPPMSLVSVGTEVRRALVLVLHDSAQPWMTAASDWAPAGKCPSTLAF
jgi:hypothetical protein